MRGRRRRAGTGRRTPQRRASTVPGLHQLARNAAPAPYPPTAVPSTEPSGESGRWPGTRGSRTSSGGARRRPPHPAASRGRVDDVRRRRHQNVDELDQADSRRRRASRCSPHGTRASRALGETNNTARGEDTQSTNSFQAVGCEQLRAQRAGDRDSVAATRRPLRDRPFERITPGLGPATGSGSALGQLVDAAPTQSRPQPPR